MATIITPKIPIIPKQIIDPKIYDLVTKFNDIGLKTSASCSGIGKKENSNINHKITETPYITFNITKKDLKLVRLIASMFLFDPIQIELPKINTKQKLWINPNGIGPREIQVTWGNQFSLVTMFLGKHQFQNGKAYWKKHEEYSTSLFQAYFDVTSFFSNTDDKNYNGYDCFGIYFGRELNYYVDFLYRNHPTKENKEIIKNLKLQWLKHVSDSIKLF